MLSGKESCHLYEAFPLNDFLPCLSAGVAFTTCPFFQELLHISFYLGQRKLR